MNPKTLALKILALQDAGWTQNEDLFWTKGPYVYDLNGGAGIPGCYDGVLRLADQYFVDCDAAQADAAIAAYEANMVLLRTHIALPLHIDHEAQYLFTYSGSLTVMGNHLAQVDEQAWWGKVARIPASLVPSALLLLAGCALQELLEGRTPAAPYFSLLGPPLALPLHYDSACQIIRDGDGQEVLTIRGWGWMQNALGTQEAAAAFQDFLGQTWARAMTQAFKQPEDREERTEDRQTAGHLGADSLYPLPPTQEKGMTIHVPTIGGFGAGRIAALQALAFEHGISVVTSQPTLPTMQITNPYEGLKPFKIENLHVHDYKMPVPDGKANRRARRAAARRKS